MPVIKIKRNGAKSARPVDIGNSRLDVSTFFYLDITIIIREVPQLLHSEAMGGRIFES